MNRSPRPPAEGVPGAGAAAQEAVDDNATGLHLPIVGFVRLPPAKHLAFYAGLVVLTAAELIDWPVALVVGVGKALADNRWSRSLQDLGEILEATR